MSHGLPCAWVVACLAFGGISGCGEDRGDETAEPGDRETAAPGDAARHLLLITIDTLRADRLGTYGGPPTVSPTLDRLAASGVQFDRAYATVPLTLPSHASMMTGLWPFVHGVRINGTTVLSDEATTLAEWLADDGFDTAAFPAAPVVAAGFGLEQGFATYDDGGADGTPPERPGAETLKRFGTWLDARGNERWFAWVHFFEPHTPYAAPAEVRARFASPYVAEVHHVDGLVGRLLAQLRQGGVLDDTLVCVTSDHGEGLGEHGEETHGTFVYDSTLRVPWILTGAGITPDRTVTDVVSHVDLAPTVLSLLGVEPFPCSGRSVVGTFDDAQQVPSPRPAYGESYWPSLEQAWSPLEALVDGDWKLIDAPRPELFDISRDPREQQDLAIDDGERLRAMQQSLTAWPDGVTPLAGGDRGLSPDELARLRALGYAIGGGHHEPPPRPGPDAGPDPKDRKEALLAVQELVNRQLTRDDVGTIRAARELLLRDAGNPYALAALGTALAGRGSYEEALPHLQALEACGRATPESQLSLAVALLHGDRYDEAQAAFDGLFVLTPGEPRAMRWQAELYERQGDTTRALETYRAMLKTFDGPPAARAFLESAVRRLEES